ncbi:hypothetical protein TNCV_1714791 [Trichonephila clavipes]|nr:hypothetical protein TNCV_1714791 [Trichonephila clavipes]
MTGMSFGYLWLYKLHSHPVRGYDPRFVTEWNAHLDYSPMDVDSNIENQKEQLIDVQKYAIFNNRTHKRRPDKKLMTRKSPKNEDKYEADTYDNDNSDCMNGDRFNSCQVVYSQFGLAIQQNDHQARRRFVEWAQTEIAVVPDFHKRILFSDEAPFWLNGYVNKQNCCIWSEANPQLYDETPYIQKN